MKTAWLYSLLTLTTLLLGAASLQAATADIADIAFTTAPTEITAGEKGYFTVEARDSVGNAETADSNVTVTLDDGAAGGTFYEPDGGSCSDTALSGSTTTIANGSSTANFCYENDSDGDYGLTASISESGTGASGYAADDTYGTENVWTNNYSGVWHMQEDPSGTAPQITDSTSGGNNGTSNGSMTSGDLLAGLMGNSVDFDGSDDYIDIADISEADDAIYTQSIWVKTAHSSSLDHMLAEGNTGDDVQAAHISNNNGTARALWRSSNNDLKIVDGTTNIADDQWHMVTGVADGSNLRLFVDGSEEGTSVSIDGAMDVNVTALGRLSRQTPGGYTDGQLDDAQISSVARSSDWLAAEYINKSTPATFYSTGAEETDPGGSWYGSDWDHRKQITIAASEVGSDLTDFPVYVDLSDLGGDFFAGVKDNGGDIRITTADGTTELAREVVSVDTGSETGELHFKADSISSSADTDFYIYYGNGTSSATTSVSVTAISTASSGSGDVLEPGGQESDGGDKDMDDNDEDNTESADESEDDMEDEGDEDLTSQEVSYYRQVLNDARRAVNEIIQSFIKKLIKQRTGLEF